MYHDEAITIRRGDSVKLQCMATCGGGTVRIDANGDGIIDWTGTDADAFAYKYAASGIYTAVAYNAAGARIGSSRITVTIVNLDGPIACQVGYEREKGVEVDVQSTSGIFFTSSDPTVMSVRVKQATPYGFRLYIKALKQGQASLVARAGSVTGSILAIQPVDIYTFINTGASGVLKGSEGYGVALLHMTPFVPGLSLHLEMFAGRSAFDAAGSKTMVYNPSAWETGIDENTGISYGVIYQKIYIPIGADVFCYKARLDQHSRYGSWSSLDNASNGECYGAEMRDAPAVVAFSNEPSKEYKGTFAIRCVDAKGNPKTPHKEVTWEYITGTIGHTPAKDTDITQYVPNVPAAKRGEDLVTELKFPAAQAEQAVPKTIKVYPPRKVGNDESGTYRVVYYAKLKSGFSKKVESRGKVKLGETKVKYGTFAISCAKDYLAVVYSATGAGDVVPAGDKITINVTKGKADSASWKFTGTAPTDLSISGTETSATITANGTQANPGGPYTIEVASQADAYETATVTIGVGAASWETFSADGEGPIVMAAGAGGKDWLVLTGGAGQAVTLKMRGSKAVFDITPKGDSEIVANPATVTASDTAASITLSKGASNRKFARGVYLKTGSGSNSVDYPNSSLEGLNVRIYAPASRTVKAIFVYYLKDGRKIDLTPEKWSIENERTPATTHSGVHHETIEIHRAADHRDLEAGRGRRRPV